MPTFKIEVVEVRHVRCDYWVEVDDVNDLEDVIRKAEDGETVHEEYGKYDVHEREIAGEPVLRDLTPLEHVRRHLDKDARENLDDVVNDAMDGKASDINNGGEDAQLRFLIEEFGESEAIKAIKAING